MGGGGGGGGGAVFESNILSVYLYKEKEKKKLTEPGFEPKTSGLEIH